MPKGIPHTILGFIASGDIDGLTMYTDRHMVTVAFAKAPPDKPPSPLQVVQRARFGSAVANWRAASPAQRDLYEQISLRCSLCMTGHNVWLHLSFHNSQALLDTLNTQAQTNATLPPAV